MQVETGSGLGAARDGMVRFNTLACYTHVHADGTKIWAATMVSRAADYAVKRWDENNSRSGGLESEAI
jgi:cobyrinic acid a,c-diamide synthase